MRSASMTMVGVSIARPGVADKACSASGTLNAGCTSTVIDGICRDVALCMELNYPVFSKDHWMRTGKDRVQVEATGIPVNIGDARVSPGDIVKGDADGVVIIPKEHEALVLETAEAIDSAEARVRAAVRGGMRLDEARKANGYHQLQTRAS